MGPNCLLQELQACQYRLPTPRQDERLNNVGGNRQDVYSIGMRDALPDVQVSKRFEIPQTPHYSNTHVPYAPSGPESHPSATPT
jgi:hypothetical protein